MLGPNRREADLLDLQDGQILEGELHPPLAFASRTTGVTRIPAAT